MRKPRPIKIIYKGQEIWLKPENVGMKELKRVHKWLGRYIEYWKGK